jgi:hypothetical protein
MLKTYEQVYTVCKTVYEDPLFILLVTKLVDDYSEENYNSVLKYFRQRFPDYTSVLLDQRGLRFFDSNIEFGSPKLLDIVISMQNSYALSYLYVQPLSQNIRAKGLFRKMICQGYGYREGRRSSLNSRDDTTLYRWVSKAYAANERLKTPWVVTVFDKPQTPFPTLPPTPPPTPPPKPFRGCCR